MINVFIYIDALPLNHINPIFTPFLDKLKNDKNDTLFDLKNIMGYSFAIQSTILAGEMPWKTGHWMPYFYAPERVSYLHRALAHIAQRMNIDLFDSRVPLFLKYLRIGLMPLVLFRKGVTINSIPLRVLDRFCTYKYYFMNELPFYGDLREELYNEFGATLFYFGPPLDSEPVNSLIDRIRQLKAQNREICDALIIVYLGRLDGVGHEYGTRSKEWMDALSEIDHKVEYLYRFLMRSTEDFNLMIFSDHGTCDIIHTIDINSHLRKKCADVWKDLTIFIDATLTLIWVEKKDAKKRLDDAIKSMCSQVVSFDIEADSGVLTKYGVPSRDRKYGDVIIQTKPGSMFFPNFYSDTKPLKGAHGYLPTEEHQRSFLLFVPGSKYANKKHDIIKHRAPTHIKDTKRFLFGLFK